MVSTSMKSLSQQYGRQFILSDAAAPNHITPDWFKTEYWQQHGGISPVELGRGAAWFIHAHEQEQHYVLRHYRRGGLIANISLDHYLWTGLDSTRAWREWKLLAHIQGCGLPGPKPLAARVVRHGLFYSADIMTHKLGDTVTLSSYLSGDKLSASKWQSIGSCIRKFHNADIYHADLNAHNLLLDDKGRVYIIDFDKGRIDMGSSWHSKNLQRLHHSLDKLSRQTRSFNFTEDNWGELEQGYSNRTNHG